MKPSIKNIVWTMLVATAAVNVIGVAALSTIGAPALGLAVGMTAMIAFVGMLMLAREPNGSWRLSESAMRTAIASAFIAEYIALLSMVAFSKAGGELSQVGEKLVTSFTNLVGVVVAFYFGASAYVEGRRLSTERRADAPQADPAAAASSRVTATY